MHRYGKPPLPDRLSDEGLRKPRPFSLDDITKTTSCPNLAQLHNISKINQRSKQITKMVDSVPIDEGEIPLESIRTLYNDRLFLPRISSNTSSNMKIQGKVIRAFQYGIIVLPFILDYATDIASSGAGYTNGTNQPCVTNHCS